MSEDGRRPGEVKESFDVTIEMTSGPGCPFPSINSCVATLEFDSLRGGSSKTRTVVSETPVPRPTRSGSVYEYTFFIVIDPSDRIPESDETDNTDTERIRVRYEN